MKLFLHQYINTCMLFNPHFYWKIHDVRNQSGLTSLSVVVDVLYCLRPPQTPQIPPENATLIDKNVVNECFLRWHLTKVLFQRSTLGDTIKGKAKTERSFVLWGSLIQSRSKHGDQAATATMAPPTLPTSQHGDQSPRAGNLLVTCWLT